MQPLIALLNGHPTAYIALCYLSLAVTIGLGARALWAGWLDALSGAKLVRPHWTKGLAFLLALAVTVVLFRLPATLTDRVLNFDEYGQLVGGWSLLHDPVPWRGCDNATSGPLNMYILTAAFWLGLPVQLITARIVMVALALILIGCTYATLLKLSGQLAAVPAALALGLFVCLARDPNHVHYNSESLSVALLAGALLLYVHSRGHPARRLTLLYGAGLLLGAIPYAKLQAGPLGAFLALAFALDLWRSRRDTPGGWPRLLALGLGGVSVPLLMTVVLLVTGTWQDFVTSYFSLANSHAFTASSDRLAFFAFCGPDMPWFLLYSMLVTIGPFACVDRIPGPLPRRFRLLVGRVPRLPGDRRVCGASPWERLRALFSTRVAPRRFAHGYLPCSGRHAAGRRGQPRPTASGQGRRRLAFGGYCGAHRGSRLRLHGGMAAPRGFRSHAALRAGCLLGPLLARSVKAGLPGRRLHCRTGAAR